MNRTWWLPEWLCKLASMYRDGYRHSSLARKLFWLILIKVAILLLVFKLWLMPNYLNTNFDTDEEKANSVRQELISR